MGGVLANKSLLTGTVLANKSLLTRTVPANKSLLTGTVPVNNSILFLYIKAKQSKVLSAGTRLKAGRRPAEKASSRNKTIQDIEYSPECQDFRRPQR